MVETATPTHVRIRDAQFDLRQIHQRFASTQYGEHLAAQTRYNSYKPEGTPNLHWQRLLGPDVNNLAHLRLSLDLTRLFLNYCDKPPQEWQGEVPEAARFSPEEQGLLLLTAVSHDWAEAIKGDIAFHEKTKADELDELTILQRLIPEVLGTDNPEAIHMVAEDVAMVLTDRGSKLGKAFNSIERAGYVRTGLRAFKHSEKVNGNLGNSLRSMGLHVSTFHIPHLLDYSRVYPPIFAFLSRNEPHLTEALAAACTEEVRFPNVPDDYIHSVRQRWEEEFLGK